MRFRNYSINNNKVTISNLSSTLVLFNSKPSLTTINLTLGNITSPGKSIIFISFLCFNIPVPFILYDGKLEVMYLNKKNNQKIIEKCDGTCNKIFLDFGVFSYEEKRIKKIQLSNPSPTFIKVKLKSQNSSFVLVELNCIHNKNKKIDNLKRIYKINEYFELCSFCFLELDVIVSSENVKKESFFIEFASNHSKILDSFKILGLFETINGSLLVPSSSNIRFQPGFPGTVQTKFVSIKSSFPIDCKVLEVESADPRIIPYIIKDSIGAYSKEEFIKVVFDPSTLQRENVKKKYLKKKILIFS